MFHHINHINRMKIKGKDKKYSEKLDWAKV